MARQGAPLEEILPDEDTGTILAQDLNNWALYLASTRRNNVAPSEKAEGTLWYRDDLGNRALMLTTQANLGLVDIELARITEPNASGGGTLIPAGVEIEVGPAAPPDPADGDLWFTPGGVFEGYGGSYTNWQASVYDAGVWNSFIDVNNANIVTSTTLGQEPDLGDLHRHYGLLWMDTIRGADPVDSNNGLMVWNGTRYVPSWPVIDGQTMLKVASSGGDPLVAPDVGLAHINTSDQSYWFSTGTEWIDLSFHITFVATAEEAVGGSEDLAMSPHWTTYSINEYRKANVVQVFDSGTWGDLVETIGAGANIGKIDPSLTIATGLGYQGTFTAEAGNEYPPGVPQKGDYWIYLNDPSWPFSSGNLSGQTINKGEGIALNAAGVWEIIDVVLNTDAFVHRDGSLSVYQPLAFTNPSGGDTMNLDYKSIFFAAGMLFTIAPTAAQASGLRVADSGYVGAGNVAPTAPFEAHGVAFDAPGDDNNILKVSSDNFAYEWLGLRYSRTLNTWNFDTDNNTSAINSIAINRSTGYVGLGVPDPTVRLHVAGGAQFSTNVVLTAGNVNIETGDLNVPAGNAVIGEDLTVSGISTLGSNPTDDSVSVVQINGPLLMNNPLSGGNLGAPIRMVDGDWSSVGVVNCRYRRMPDGTVVLETTGDPGGTLPAGYAPENNLSFIALGDTDADYAELNIATNGDITTGKLFSTRSHQQFRYLPVLSYF